MSFKERRKDKCWISNWLRFFITCSFLTLFSFVCFAILATVVSQYHYFKLVGPQVLISWGSALAIVGLLTLMIGLVSYDIVTCCWAKCCKSNCLLIDKKILFHQICGYMILVYSTSHTIGHLTGSMVTASHDNLEDINAYFMRKTFDWQYSYAYLVFLSIPGSTGWILWIFFILITVTSLKCFW